MGGITLYYIGSVLFPDVKIWNYIGILVGDEGGVAFILAGISFFLFFNQIEMKTNKVINTLGGTTLAVLMLHDGHFSRNWTWSLLHTTEWYYSRIYILRVLACEVIIYGVATGIDLIRRKYLEEPLFRTKRVKNMCLKINSIFE